MPTPGQPSAAASEKERALLALHEDIRRCQRCPLHLTRTQAVPGVGPAGASVMLVGEAPGRQEDLTGEPFVGSAGRFLDGLLAAVGVSRHDVYITNVVKSRPFVGPPPGQNRAPAGSEIVACRIWLDEQLRLIQPVIVVAMGRIALEYFVRGKKISDVHGQPLQLDGRTILPLFHPAVAYHRQELRDTLKQDFLALRELMQAKPAPPAAAVPARSAPAANRKERPRRAKKALG